MGMKRGIPRLTFSPPRDIKEIKREIEIAPDPITDPIPTEKRYTVQRPIRLRLHRAVKMKGKGHKSKIVSPGKQQLAELSLELS